MRCYTLSLLFLLLLVIVFPVLAGAQSLSDKNHSSLKDYNYFKLINPQLKPVYKNGKITGYNFFVSDIKLTTKNIPDYDSAVVKYFLYPVISSKEGSIVYDGFYNLIQNRTTCGYIKGLNYKSDPIFYLPIERINLAEGKYNLIFNIHSIHTSGKFQSSSLYTCNLTLTMPTFYIGEITIKPIKFSRDNYDDDPYFILEKNSEEYDRSPVYEDDYSIPQLTIDLTEFSKDDKWYITYYDEDLFNDDRLFGFNLGDLTKYGENFYKFSGYYEYGDIYLSFKVNKILKPAVHYNDLKLRFNNNYKYNQLSGRLITLSGDFLKSRYSKDFTYKLALPLFDIKSQLIHQSTDSISYFIPFYSSSTNEINFYWNLNYTPISKDIWNYYSHIPNNEDTVTDNNYSNILANIKTIKNTTCLEVTGEHYLPKEYLAKFTCKIKANVNNKPLFKDGYWVEEKIIDSENKKFSFSIPLHRLSMPETMAISLSSTATSRIDTINFQSIQIPAIKKTNSFNRYEFIIKHKLKDRKSKSYQWKITDTHSGYPLDTIIAGTKETFIKINKCKDDYINLVLINSFGEHLYYITLTDTDILEGSKSIVIDSNSYIKKIKIERMK